MFSGKIIDGDFVGEYVKALLHSFSKSHLVNLVCYDDVEERLSINKNLNIFKTSCVIKGNNLFNWAMIMNTELGRAGREVYECYGFDIIHANDWLTIPVALSMARFAEKPLILSMHSTEKERGFGIDYSGLIHEIEGMGLHNASHILVDNEVTMRHVINDFNIEREKITLLTPFRDKWDERILELYKKLAKVGI